MLYISILLVCLGLHGGLSLGDQKLFKDALICICKQTIKTQGFDGREMRANVCADYMCQAVYENPVLVNCTQLEIETPGGLTSCIYRNTPFCFIWVPDMKDANQVANYIKSLAECSRSIHPESADRGSFSTSNDDTLVEARMADINHVVIHE